MSSQQKRGFRLPWAADRASEEGAAGAATLDPASGDATSGVESDDLGEGPFRLAGASPTSTTDPVPAESDVQEVSAEATMIEVESTQSPAAEEQQEAAARGSGWPDVDSRTAPHHAGDTERAAARPAIHASGESRGPRRENPLVAGLVKAMREAAIASRDETISRLHVDAETRVAGIRGRATDEATELKHRAETDIAEIREWSKGEIARIREKTENRIEARKTELAGETERHGASVERLVADVESVVAAFQTDMDVFFERLLAEGDPARVAALAEQAPDAPDLTGDGPSAIDMLGESEVADRLDMVAPAPIAGDEAPDAVEAPVEPALEVLESEAAAAAEVAASEGLDMRGADWPTVAGGRASDPAADAEDDGATRLMVTGLGTVAGISAFKGALGLLPGVRSVSVSSGDPGVFVFAISHDPQIDLATGIAGLPGFTARITDATDTGITVVAHETAA